MPLVQAAIQIATQVTWLAVGMGHLPFELLQMIFGFCLGDFWSNIDRKLYAIRRRALTQVCGTWRAVMSQSPRLWNSFDSNLNSNCDLIASELACCWNVPLFIRISLGRKGLLSVPELLGAFRQAMPRAQRLTFVVDTPYNNTLTRTIRNIPLPETLELSIRDVCGAFVSPNPVVLSRTLSKNKLEILRVQRTWILWNTLPPCASLRILVISNVNDYFPDWEDWQALSSSSPNIERMALLEIGCTNVPAIERDEALHFPSLIDLRLHFGLDGDTLSDLVNTFKTPRLRKVSIEAHNIERLRRLRSGGISGAVHLRLSIKEMFLSFSHDLFSFLPALSSLYIQRIEGFVLDALSPKRGEAILCSKLTLVYIERVAPIVVRGFLSSRASAGAKIATIACSPGFTTDWGHPDLEWIRTQVKLRERLIYREPDWLDGMGRV
ncbi:hypothetical protein B0H16DRAFT_1733629 [Mycena metata]|uniref:F-box domain-containing protein n=1 Tax=Mycena metata TaxID=1033252 RepID=A0AAD7HZB0_9AGAR|nr:hypothetical protein B0H16DRAFT_1733629 [Mycena metata]